MSQKPNHFYCELWKMNFYYFIAWKPKDFLKYMSDKFNYERKDGLVGTDGTTLVVADKPIVCIWTRKRTDYPVLAHECLHAAKE